MTFKRLSWLHFSIQWLLGFCSYNPVESFCLTFGFLHATSRILAQNNKVMGGFVKMRVNWNYLSGMENDGKQCFKPTKRFTGNFPHTHISHYGLCSHGQPFSAGKFLMSCWISLHWMCRLDISTRRTRVFLANSPTCFPSRDGSKMGHQRTVIFGLDSSIFWSQSSWPIPIWNH